MDDLAAPVGEQEKTVLQPLTDRKLQRNKRFNDDSVCRRKATKLPTSTETGVTSLREKKKRSAITSRKAATKTKEEEENDDKKINKDLSDLPETFSLVAPINVPHDTTAHEILSMSAKRIQKSADFKPIFDEEVCAPSPPLPPKVEDEVVQDGIKQTRLPTVYYLETRVDANCEKFRKRCEKEPIAVVRGFTTVTKMDLSVFETSRISAVAGSEELEIRSQNFVSRDKNVDTKGKPTWECSSKKETMTIEEYAKYQAGTSNMSLKEKEETLRQSDSNYTQQTTKGHGGKRRKVANAEKTAVPMKPIKFGTNVDLSDESKWKSQYGEMKKVSRFIRHNDPQNILSHIGHQVLGMNTVQLYMKVPGSRTPAHQENNSFASININVGPGDCEWFAVPYEYWGVIEKLCKKHKVNFLSDSYWPNLDELLAENVPVYRFTQEAGDLVWVGSGCVHWVQAVGACNNISWNVGPLNSDQLSISIRSYEWNKLNSYKSLVPMQHLAWQLAKNVKFPDKSTYDLIRGLLIRSLSFCQIVIDYATAHGKSIESERREKKEVTHYCDTCEIEVFNILFLKKVDEEFAVHCVYCSQKQGLDNFIVVQQIEMSILAKIYDDMVRKQPPNIALTA